MYDIGSEAAAMRVPLPAEAADTTALLYVEAEGMLSLEWVVRQSGSQHRALLAVHRLVTVRPWTGRECT